MQNRLLGNSGLRVFPFTQRMVDGPLGSCEHFVGSVPRNALLFSNGPTLLSLIINSLITPYYIFLNSSSAISGSDSTVSSRAAFFSCS